MATAMNRLFPMSQEAKTSGVHEVPKRTPSSMQTGKGEKEINNLEVYVLCLYAVNIEYNIIFIIFDFQQGINGTL